MHIPHLHKKIFISSANTLNTLPKMLSSKSLIKVKNNRGPRTEPWGTPCLETGNKLIINWKYHSCKESNVKDTMDYQATITQGRGQGGLGGLSPTNHWNYPPPKHNGHIWVTTEKFCLLAFQSHTWLQKALWLTPVWTATYPIWHTLLSRWRFKC